MIKIAILGCGRIGKVHARATQANGDATLVAVVDAMPQTAAALAMDTGSEARSIEAIMASPDVDAVVIGTPTATHYDFIH